MKAPRWLEGGAFVPTTAGTLLWLLSAPFGGLGVITLVFGAWRPALIFIATGVVFWISGRRLMDR